MTHTVSTSGIGCTGFAGVKVVVAVRRKARSRDWRKASSVAGKELPEFIR
jgi:hypothetical protein